MMAVPAITTVTLTSVTPGPNTASRKSRSMPPITVTTHSFLGTRHVPWRWTPLRIASTRSAPRTRVAGDLRSFPRADRLWVQHDPVGAYGLGDVLDLLRTKILEARGHLIPQAVVDAAGDRDPTRLRDLLHAGCDVDTIAVNVVVLDDHVAEVDSDTENDLLILGLAGIARGHPALNLDSALHGIEDTCELDEQAVPHQLDDAALVLGDLGLDELGAMGTKAGERAFLVEAH